MSGTEQLIVSNSVFTARRIGDRLDFAVGSIGADALRTDESETARMQDVIDRVVEVAPTQQRHSNCTDGRMPDVLDNGAPVPVRPQTVGENLGLGFYVMEGLGLLPKGIPADEGVFWSAHELKEMGFVPDAHRACAACLGYVTVKENGVRFDGDLRFHRRQMQTMGAGAYDSGTQYSLMDRQRAQLKKPGYYNNLTLDTFLDAATAIAGPEAVGSYVDDGRGVHGHVEDAVALLKTPGYAIDNRALNATGGEVFGGNLDVIDNMAAAIVQRYGGRLFGPARQLGYTFTNSGHGTLLTPDSPTWVVEPRADRV